jgi:NAD(P)-dependent dehydrogenase (short-subunit alcohol dehydrogenase family)
MEAYRIDRFGSVDGIVLRSSEDPIAASPPDERARRIPQGIGGAVNVGVALCVRQHVGRVGLAEHDGAGLLQPIDWEAFLAAIFYFDLHGKPQEIVDGFATLAPLERLGRRADIAATAAFLTGPDSAWINGQTLRANGGII